MVLAQILAKWSELILPWYDAFVAPALAGVGVGAEPIHIVRESIVAAAQNLGGLGVWPDPDYPPYW